jgi:hypothetical protein
MRLCRGEFAEAMRRHAVGRSQRVSAEKGMAKHYLLIFGNSHCVLSLEARRHAAFAKSQEFE